MRRFGNKMLARVVVMTVLATALAIPAAAMAPAQSWSEALGFGEAYAGGDAGTDGSVILGGRSDDTSGESAGFVRSVDASGAETWRVEVDNPGSYEGVFDIATKTDGVIYAVGETRGDVAAPVAGGIDTWVRGFSATGATLWTDQFGTLDDDAGRAIAVALDGSVYVAGSTSGMLSTGGGGGVFDGFVRKYSSTGTVLWTIEFGGTGDEIVTDMAVANDGTVWVVGHVAPPESALTDAFITRVSANGAVQATDLFNDTIADVVLSKVKGVAAHPDGGVVVGGDYQTDVIFGGFIVRYQSDASEAWAVQGTEVGAIFGVDVAPNGNVYVVGFPPTGVFEEGYYGAYGADGAFLWSEESFSSNSTFVVATSDNGLFVHSANILSAPGENIRLGATGGGGTFTDVSGDAFYADAVEWLKAEGITTGTSATTYSPDNVVTRGQMAAFLHRLVGEPGGSPAHGFSDVSAGAFYADAVAWLKAAGVTTGTSATTYSPDNSVTRGQMAAFLWRLAGEPGGSPAHGFSDVSAGAFYADAVAWLKAQGITTGTSATTYSPDAVVTRGQMAAFLFRMATDSDWVRPAG